MKRICILGPIGDGRVVSLEKMEKYAEFQKKKGNAVFLLAKDINLDVKLYDISEQICSWIGWSDEVHIFCDPKSESFTFCLGMVFVLGKKIKVVENVLYEQDKKSIPKMLFEWEIEQDKSADQLTLKY
jgi:hypothetical protein